MYHRAQSTVGAYKYIMMCSSAADILFSFSNIVTCPMMTFLHAEKYQALLVVNNGIQVGFYFGSGMLTIALFFLTQSILTPPIAFIFRYLQICRPHELLDNKKKYQAQLAIPFSSLILGATLLTFVSFPTPDDIKYLSDIVTMFTKQLTWFETVCYLVTWFITIFYAFMLVISLIIMIFCSVKIVKKLEEEKSVSPKTYRMQKRLYQMLILQFLCPLFLLQVPFSYSFILPVLNLTANGFAHDLLPFLFAWTPFLNAIILLAFMEKFRSAITSFKLFSTVQPSNTPRR
ncbi:unnamed protein product [Caenorhabditis auriculariae]|uniref:G-protein coupled receptors family 1 profile domain-containing protein n=1 Tax=Caenorhabditis auriculariae TaxID=2777116 RepID=A0A8S1HGI9_9PELO|nr:unnamed protein product [Caenorhabditis auriculariae]